MGCPSTGRMRPVTVKKPDLEHSFSCLLDECRMVLPGIQALFGFQLIAVFNERFAQMPCEHQVAHLPAKSLAASSAALIMTPAAYHRATEPKAASAHLVQLSTRLLLF